MTTALNHRGACSARQVEEHYYRKSTESRAINVRARLEQAVESAPTQALARKILKLDEGRSDRPALKKRIGGRSQDMTTTNKLSAADSSLDIHVVQPGTRTRKGWVRCQIGSNVKFSPRSIASYFFAEWDAFAYEALLVAAVVEFADRSRRRPATTWRREFTLRIPVENPDRWNDRNVSEALHDALNFLTGDLWSIEFYRLAHPWDRPAQVKLNLPAEVNAVIPFSNGLDSRAVAGLMEIEMDNKLVRVRLGTRVQDREAITNERHPFTSVPYEVRSGSLKFVEPTARTRGFKFALVSAVAARLAGAGEVIVPESGQGALGPVLVSVGQSLPGLPQSSAFHATHREISQSAPGDQYPLQLSATLVYEGRDPAGLHRNEQRSV